MPVDKFKTPDVEKGKTVSIRKDDIVSGYVVAKKVNNAHSEIVFPQAHNLYGYGPINETFLCKSKFDAEKEKREDEFIARIEIKYIGNADEIMEDGKCKPGPKTGRRRANRTNK